MSHRAQAISPFYAMEFGKTAALLESQGHRVIKLSLGEPDFGAPPTVLHAMREIMDGRPMPYTSAVGLPTLREKISRFYLSQHDLLVDPSRIIVTSGASAALLLVLAATIDPGDKVMIGDPSYPCNRQLVETFGGQVSLVPTETKTRFQLSSALVQKHWSDQTSALMVATPSNPTGTSIPIDELAKICQFAREQGAWRIVDEIYLYLGDRDIHSKAPCSVLSVDPDAIVINSFSKYFGMTGWRLGWCIVPENLVQPMERLAQNYLICPSTPAQHAALECFTVDTLAICEQRRVEFTDRRTVVLEGLASIGLPVSVPPDGAFYVYFDVSHTGLTSWDFCERALQEVHVALTPGHDFGHHSATSHVRLSYAASVEDLREGIQRLQRFLITL